MVWSEIEGWKRAKQLRVILIGFSIFTVLVVGANIAMAISVAGRAPESPQPACAPCNTWCCFYLPDA